MIAAKPCTAIWVMEGIAVLVSFYPDSAYLRLTDAAGRCFQEGRWEGSWSSLMSAFREFRVQPRPCHSDVGDLLNELLLCAQARPKVAAPDGEATPAPPRRAGP
jgi:hypothetical protein